uniref:Trafficking protein particle complex subunit n=1 Tax=Euplotes harpa TaxID=151035 RepID=A0A7S3J3V8_9SPIT|mmetsp:Transcript_18650/g.21423  ORF Transcript_18650/g.21423 Transcript_18650/m.21423 type:complete len:138 (+) Transcript_18650:22-435(+)
MSIYELMIFTRKGDCIFHLDLTGTLDFTDLGKIKARRKLIFGLLHSLKSYVKMLSANEFKCYATERYKLHIYELITGIKFVLISSPKIPGDLTHVLKNLYITQYIPFLSKNIVYKLGTPIKCKYFRDNVEEELRQFS